MVIRLPKVKFSKGVCQGCILGKRNIKFSKGVYQGCILGKHPEHKFEKASHERTFAPLELIHGDIAGPFPHMSMRKPNMHWPS